MTELETNTGPRIAYIRTSDRQTFRRCRRKWGWNSGLKQNLTSTVIQEQFWVGKAMHFALEDYHGYNVYGSPTKAILAFKHAWDLSRLQLPDNSAENLDLLIGMMGHYENWLIRRDPLKTYWYEGYPQVEVRYDIPLDFDLTNHPLYDEVHHSGALDRVVEDDFGGLWIVEYKSAKQFDVIKFDVDAQVSSYSWAASVLYDRPIQGVIYQQHLKRIPEPARLLRSGKYSTDQRQYTTWDIYNKALKELYGDVAKAPAENIEMLNFLAEGESENHDRFIRRDKVHRNQHQIEAEGVKILLELEDILNPNIPLYPNPTWDCSWDCKEFITPCVMLDSGDDWLGELAMSTAQREEVPETWRLHLPEPEIQEKRHDRYFERKRIQARRRL